MNQRRGFWLIPALLLVAWAAAVRLGLAALVLGPDRGVGDEALLVLPGAAVALLLVFWEARRRLVPVEQRWQAPPHSLRAPAEQPIEPKQPPEPIVGVGPRPGPRPTTAAAGTPRRAGSSEVVTLGSRADPAYATWQLHWDAGEVGKGRVVLPFGDHVSLGRAPSADIRVDLEQVSWKHLEFQVRHGEVRVMDLGSSNGTVVRHRDVEARLPARSPLAIVPGAQIQLAEPWAVVLTLEPLRAPAASGRPA